MKRWIVEIAVVVVLAGVGLVEAAINIDMVTVGNPGNANDTTGYGAVSYNFDIGKYEVTNAQYCEFLNAKAKSDPYALYSTYMNSDARGGITRSGSLLNYSYSVKSGYGNMPVVCVGWYDTVRFANWLTNGQDGGDTESGSYTITAGGLNSGTVTIPNAVQRAAWAAGTNRYWLLPSEDEWYKAAYHKSDGATAYYWEYATGTNAVPYSDNPAALNFPANSANYLNDDGIANGYNDGYAVTGSPTLLSTQNYLTDVGAYSQSPSPYGTFDQNGNVIEWNEALISSWRGHRGGSWYWDSGFLAASYRDAGVVEPGHSASEVGDVGFRVASVFAIPEPSTLIIWSLLGTLGIGLGWWRRKRAA